MKTLRAFLLVSFAALPVSALASSNGIGGLGPAGCNGCHFGGTEPTTMLSLSKTQVMPGETIQVTVTVSTPNGTTGGFNLRSTQGTLSNPGAGMRLLGQQATHSSPKTEDGSGNLVFNVDWTAPQNGTVTFTAFGNSVNGNGFESGDKGSSATGTVAVCGTTFFLDADMDGVGGMMSQMGCTAPTGYVAMGGDCDDANPNVKPGATETCNMVDDDCDMDVDDGAGETYNIDADGDGFGDSANAMTACAQPTGYVTDGTDCDDSSATVNPDATETCNGIDDDCDGMNDDGLMCAGNGQDGGTTGGTDGGTSNGGDGAGGCNCASVPVSSLAGIALIMFVGALSRRRRPATPRDPN